jgi:hypothetical protein
MMIYIIISIILQSNFLIYLNKFKYVYIIIIYIIMLVIILIKYLLNLHLPKNDLT